MLNLFSLFGDCGSYYLSSQTIVLKVLLICILSWGKYEIENGPPARLEESSGVWNKVLLGTSFDESKRKGEIDNNNIILLKLLILLTSWSIIKGGSRPLI